MFKFLKEKLSKAVSIFSKKVEQEAEIKEEEKEIVKELPKETPVKAKEPAKPEVKEDIAKKEQLARIAEEKKKKEEEEQERVLEEKKKREEERKKAEEKKLAEKKRKEQEQQEGLAKAEQEEKDKAAEREREGEERKNFERRKIEEEQERLAAEEKEKEERKKESFLKRLFHKKHEEEKKEAPVKEERKEEKTAEAEEKQAIEEKKDKKELETEAEEEEKKKGFFAKVKETLTTIKLSEEKFHELFWDLELAMLENNVAVEVIEKIKEDLKEALTTGRVSRKGIDELIHDSLKESIESLFMKSEMNIIDEIRNKKDKPYIISFIGVNGSGKTTTMAKIAHLLLKNKLTVVFAASDTFRAAAIQQLQEHADRLGVKMIRHEYESDPAAVAFDAIKHAQAKGIDVVLIDTAGRLHSNDNLMNELKKLIKVNKPDLKIFVGESITGNDCVEQAKLFNEAVGIDAIVLAKADVDEKGGASISVSYVTKKPIIYLGTGQNYDDLTEFNPEIIMQSIGL